jgi:predicted metalloprotease
VSKYDGIDRDAVTRELENFLRETEPVSGGSGTMVRLARCGAPKARELEERVRPILNRLYPEWRDENSASVARLKLVDGWRG